MQAYHQTDEIIHQLCQTIAKVNRTYVPAKKDDSHTNLYFDATEIRIFGRWFEVDGRKYIFSLRLSRLSYELLNDRQLVVASISAAGKTIAEIESEMELIFKNLGVSTNGLTSTLHYEITVYDFIENTFSELDTNSLDQWIYYRGIANHVCSDLLGLAQINEEIRIWPHHFDTGIYIEPNDAIGVGFGLAMEDSMVGDPYFYLSGYPKGKTIDYDSVPAGDFWKWEVGENWKGCVLPLTQLEGLSASERNERLGNYINTNYKWLLKQ